MLVQCTVCVVHIARQEEGGKGGIQREKVKGKDPGVRVTSAIFICTPPCLCHLLRIAMLTTHLLCRLSGKCVRNNDFDLL